MHYLIEAACGSRSSNTQACRKDNLYFTGRCMEENNTGLSHCVTAAKSTEEVFCLAVLDGAGSKGAYASYIAARHIQEKAKLFSQFVMAERGFLNQLCAEINEAVLRKASAHMDTNAAILLFSQEYVYACNFGGCRIYRLRDGVLLQVSVDQKPAPRVHLSIEPYIAKGSIEKGDQYLICSDGLTDTLTDYEIRTILTAQDNPSQCADSLIQTAVEHGGRDHITVITCTAA